MINLFPVCIDRQLVCKHIFIALINRFPVLIVRFIARINKHIVHIDRFTVRIDFNPSLRHIFISSVVIFPVDADGLTAEMDSSAADAG
jgi:hypothetical protein